MFSHFEPQLLPVAVELRGQRSGGGGGQEEETEAGAGHKWVHRTLAVCTFFRPQVSSEGHCVFTSPSPWRIEFSAPHD